MKNSNDKAIHSVSLLGLAINLMFYIGFVLHDGPIICVDTASYIEKAYSREPVYPLFLELLRRLFGEALTGYGTARYLLVAALLQAVLMAFCVWYTARVVAGVLPGRGRALPETCRVAIRPEASSAVEISPPQVSELLWYAFATAAFYGVDLLNRFAAARVSMYVECIMTESVCIPLFYLFIARVYLYYTRKRCSDLVWLFLLMLLMTSIRKQEMITCVILCGMSFLYELILRRRWKRFLSCVVISVATLMMMTLLDYGYNYALRGVWMHHTHNYKGGACTLLYTATADDVSLFKDAWDREIYADIYRQMEEQGLTYDSIPADADWITRTDHYADAYDVIGYDILIPTITRYVVEENPDLDEAHVQIAVDEQQKVIQNTLAGQDKGNLLSLWSGSYAEGFVNTVLRKTALLSMVALVLYLFYVAAYLFLGVPYLRRYGFHAPDARANDAHDVAEREPGTGDVLLFACLVMAAIVINVLVVGSMIFAQTRYMIYNMAFFYIALSLMAARILDK